MINRVINFILVLLTAGCSAPRPPQVSLTGRLTPVNFNEAQEGHNIVIRSEEQKQNCWRKQFSYSIDAQNHSPEFFYAVAHADQIIARIKPPFIEFVFAKVRENLRGYGITTPIELFVEEDEPQKPQVILDCVKFKEE